MKKAAEVSLGGLSSNDGFVRGLAAPPRLRLETQGLLHGDIRAFTEPAGAITPQRALDPSRKRDRLRTASYVASGQHDFAKVNLVALSVKMIFPYC
jgi:hypothetical protein